MKRILMTASAVVLLAGTGHANIADFSKLDGNSDGRLTKQEFTAAFEQTPVLTSWDLNKDQMIDANEFHTGIFNLWDENNDDQLSDQEVTSGANLWLDPKPQPVSFAAFDADESGAVSMQELKLGMPQDAGLFGAWDQNSDGQLGPQEVHAGLFEVWDTNNDDVVAQSEFEAQATRNDWTN